MTQEQIKKARTIRRRKVRERQAVVFGVLAASMGVIGLAAVGVYNGAFALPFDKGFSEKVVAQDPVFATACLPAETKPVAAGSINVAILNASERSGMAAQLSKSLGERSFKVTSTGNADAQRQTTAIYFGVQGIEEAYTLAQHFTNVALILDDSVEGPDLSVHIGAGFDSLIAAEEVALDVETPLESRNGCKDLWELTDKVEPPTEAVTEEDKKGDADVANEDGDAITDAPEGEEGTTEEPAEN